jgi:predicted RNA-binding Zn-ribbon protein involved in translation (DUF1610 family)
MSDFFGAAKQFDPSMAKAVSESLAAAVHKWRSFATKACPRCGGVDLGCVFAQNPEGRRFRCNGCGHDGPLGACFEEAGALWDGKECARP